MGASRRTAKLSKTLKKFREGAEGMLPSGSKPPKAVGLRKAKRKGM